jgi:hypothetical protein
MEYWQIAAGSRGRDYSRYFLQYGIAFAGGEVNVATLEQVQAGDVLVLKHGLYEVLAAGEVVARNGVFKGNGDKEWLYDFDGWGLEAWCYVDWHIPPHGLCVATDGLTRTTIQRLPQSRHRDIANDLIAILPVFPISGEPSPQQRVGDEEILDFLIAEGLRPSAADEITNTLRKVRLLAKYYFNNCNWEDIREHETRTFLVVPFLLALGWTEQRLKIELPCSQGKIDIACFARSYAAAPEECVLIVETKDFASGLDFAPDQGQAYASDFPGCRVVVVTNGYCYKSYLRNDDGSFRANPDAYLNLLSPTQRYPVEPVAVDGAKRLLQWLLPHQHR